MGINEPLINKEISSKFELTQKENNKLLHIYSSYIFNPNINFIMRDNFIQLLNLSDPDLFEIFLELFHKKHSRFNKIVKFKQIKKIYYCLTTEDPKIKIIFISFLLFKNEKQIKEAELSEHIKKIFKNSELYNYLLKMILPAPVIQEMQHNDKVKKAKEKDKYFTRKNFIELCNKNENITFFSNFNFVNKKFVGSSKYITKNNNKLNYICDCCKNTVEIKDNLDTMEKGYNNLARKTNGVLYLNDFAKLLNNLNIHPKMIKLINRYLEIYTQKDYCSFNDLKYIFSNLNYSVELNDKKKFLFKMILTICGKENKVTYKQIYKYLNFNPVKIEQKDEELLDINTEPEVNKIINDETKTEEKKIEEKKEEKTKEEAKISDENKTENTDEKSEENKNSEEIEAIEEENINKDFENSNFDEEEFLNSNNIFDDIFIKLIPHLKMFELIPYLLFNCKTNDKRIKRRLIIETLKNKNIENHEKYLEKSFNSCNYFYAIDTSFWNALIDENKDIPDFIDNSRIADEINLITEEEKFYNEGNEENEEKMENKENKENKENEKNEKNEKKENKGENNKENKKEENKENKNEEKKENNKEEKNEENKVEKKNKEDNKNKENKNKENKNENNKNEEIITKNGKLKKGLKYKVDFIILCDELYNIIKNNYRLNYEIRLKKIKVLYLEVKKKKEEKKEEEKKDDENEEEIKKREEELIKKENFAKENLNKYNIDEEKGIISKIVKDNNNNYISFILDFYPVQVYETFFISIIRIIENMKKRYDEFDEQRRIKKLPKKQKKRIKKQKEKEEEKRLKRLKKAKGQIKNCEIEYQEKLITEEQYIAKRKKIEEEFSDVLIKPQKAPNTYETDLALSDFENTLQRYKNNILKEKQDSILTRSRYSTCREMVEELIMNIPQLKTLKFDIYYFLFNSKELIKPEDNYILGDNANEDFITILVDIHNDKGISFHQLLEEKEKEKVKENDNIKNDENGLLTEDNKDINNENNNENNTDGNKDNKDNNIKENKEKKKEKKKLTKEEKEKQAQLEKEKKEKEKELKKKEKELKKEEEKKRAQLEKEIKEKEKEENKKRKQLEKEKEKEKERKKEREKFISPPYGIKNYGNTCYFNSVNQIFLNLPILQQIFLDWRIDYFVNKTNKFGHKGKFFEKYKSLYWIKPSKVGDTVQSLKSIVGKIKEDFNNNEQQDANEYLNFVIEKLHEELNLHSTKRYIEEKDDIFHHNTDEQLGKISWANNLKRNASFIDSIFMFQFKSNLKCRKCNTIKVNFETNYIFDLPLSLCKMVTVEVNLYRLPFRYKLYYNRINEKFDKYINLEENKNIGIVQNLWNYYTNILTIEEKKEHYIKLHFSFDLEREKNMMDITKILRGIKPLELEPENLEETINNEKIIEYKVNNLTDLITYSYEKNVIISPNSSIDKFVNINDNIILNIYEVLNSNGMKILFEEENKNIDNIINNNLTLYSYLIKKGTNINLDEFKINIKHSNYYSDNKNSNILNDNDISNNEKILINVNNNNNNRINIKKEPNILSLKENMIYCKEIINSNTLKVRKIRTEFAIPIYHYYRSNKDSVYLFRDFFHTKIKQFPMQYIILNNSYNITAKQLYEYVWYLNTIYMNHPNRNIDKFWWNININNINNENEIDNNQNIIINNNNDNNENVNMDNNNQNKESNKIINTEENEKIINSQNNNKDGKIEENKNDTNESEIKLCYPFVLRYTEIPKLKEDYQPSLIHCPKCPWHTFCPGCIINPKDNLKELTSEFGIVVDWCTSFINEEFIVPNFNLLSKEINNQVISENLNFNDKEQNYQSLKDCFELFFVEENLEDPLFCHKCQGPEDFSKKYVINKLPYVLILSLKRFKFNQNSNFKLRQMITYPLYDLELGGKKYDLFGIINHYGGINSGHYTCIIKKEKRWIMCDDSNIYEISEKKVIHPNAYILFYIDKESPYKNDYFRFMKSLMNNIEKKDKEIKINKDKNFFRGEPVITNYGEGYIIEDNIDNFVYDENYNIYDELKKKDEKRIEKIIKKDEEEDKKEKEKEKDNKEKDNKEK